jgi:hypothetical protein
MTPASARKKRQRARERKGEFIVSVVVNNQIIEGMIDHHRLADAESEDRKEIAAAIHDLLVELFPSLKKSVTRGQPNLGECGLIDSATDETET